MPVETGALPTIDRPDVDTVLVSVITTPEPDVQRHVADAVAERWRTAAWPGDLLALTCFRSTDGEAVLVYSQWGAEASARAFADDPAGVLGDRHVPGAATPESVPFRLYRVVRGSAVTTPAPVPTCFPVATFTMAEPERARAWVDGLLAAEEDAEGADRAYPGALAANFHVSVDGGVVLVLSEWVSEAEAVAHIEQVWEPILAGIGDGDVGRRYRHDVTFTAPA
ncbi:hypothetical protein [Saccharothrix obliqua]|uniref:hypothetical protein n=1 Tax=Saccharothrix obliqua TaxID=2861747 RepID=UPI001C6065D5|nr:hypothetical protein [Saccharothrix obliqua]MBW4722359.1 hypothetical protein [Saccharothrix obliqua]